MKENRASTVAAAIAAWALLCHALAGCRADVPPGGAPAKVKNLVLVSLDTLRGDRLGGVRQGISLMPRLEAFTDRAVRFTDCRSTSGHTLASHKSLLSGRLPSAWLESFSETREGPAPDNPNRYYRAAMRMWPFPALARRVSDRGWATAGFVDGGYVSERFGFAEGFDVYDESRRGLARQCAAAREWLGSLDDEPFFLFVHTYDVHCPYDPPERYLRLFDHESSGRLDFQGTCGKPYFNSLELTEEEREHIAVHYDAGVRGVDDALGEFLGWLESTGRLQDTAVVVTSDHGESLGARSFVGHGQLYENQLRVPLVIFVPGVAPAVVDTPVSGVDVAATILDLLTGEVPANLDGRSLVALLTGETPTLDDRPIVASVTVNEGRESVTRLRKTATIEGNGVKLIADPEGGSVELFDLEQDPAETRNLIGDGDPREGGALEIGRAATTEPLDGLGDGEENLEEEGLPPETMEALRALGYVED